MNQRVAIVISGMCQMIVPFVLLFGAVLTPIQGYGQLDSYQSAFDAWYKNSSPLKSQKQFSTWDVIDGHFAKKANLHFLHVQEHWNGIPISRKIRSVVADSMLVIEHVDARVVSQRYEVARFHKSSSVSPLEAVNTILRDLNLKTVAELIVPKKDTRFAIDLNGRSTEPMDFRTMYVDDQGILRQVFEIAIFEDSSLTWHQYQISVSDGSVWEHITWNSSCDLGHDQMHDHTSCGSHQKMSFEENNPLCDSSYHVIALPGLNPSDHPRKIVNRPWTEAQEASPLGWHEDSLTVGNNVIAYPDNFSGRVPVTGGDSICFDFVFDPNVAPQQNQDAAVVNLFYVNNAMHDIMHYYGFDEASGNFQFLNYSGDGLGNDPVLAEALDASGFNNANFATPPDGRAPRMQMFEWSSNGQGPNLDSGFDNGVIIHEYAHGITNRLTGGPSVSDCLSTTAQDPNDIPSEGWSDWYALVLTMTPSDSSDQSRGIATYLLGQELTDRGIRRFPYSSDTTVNPLTYEDIPGSSSPHRVGEVWSSMLWDMTWALVENYGFDEDFYRGTGGNNMALHLVTTALKIQPCSPGFVDARDAILAADEMLYQGANQCLIWESFARRGLGVGADQGRVSDRSDGVASYVTPDFCKTGLSTSLALAKSVSSPGEELSYEIVTQQHQTFVDSVLVEEDTLLFDEFLAEDIHGSIVDSSFSGRKSREGSVTAPEGPIATLVWSDNFGKEYGLWQIEDGDQNDGWQLIGSGDTALYRISGVNTNEDNALISPRLQVPTAASLRIEHAYDIEQSWDGGFVEIYAGSDTIWRDLNETFLAGGYDGQLIISSNPSSAGRMAFTGSSTDTMTSWIDLRAYEGMDVRFRFVYSTDLFVGNPGWEIYKVALYQGGYGKVITQAEIESVVARDTAVLLVAPKCFPCPGQLNCKNAIDINSITDPTYAVHRAIDLRDGQMEIPLSIAEARDSLEISGPFEVSPDQVLIMAIDDCIDP
ncbi:MAG: M36 family metallopeptidase [Bacteroidota bacterium]